MEDFCFVIQPFDGGKFDKRYDDVYKPAIMAAGLDAYRVDADDLAQVPIDTIEEKIQAATVCVADITLNNPNVWYEVGYAYASNKTVILVCSDERTEDYPFDVRNRNILNYKTESESDYQEFRQKLTKRIEKLKSAKTILPVASVNKSVDNFEGLTYQEITFLGAVLLNQDSMDDYVSTWSVKEQMKRSGLNEISFNICMRKLLAKKFIEVSVVDEYNGNEYHGIIVTPAGDKWILENEDKFSVEYQEEKEEKSIEFNLPFN